MTEQLTAADRFVLLGADINDLLERITEHAVEDHFGVDPDKITWGDVGTAASFYERLEQISKFLNIDTTK